MPSNKRAAMMGLMAKKSHKTLGEQLKEERKRRDLTQSECAKMVGISQGHWSALENDALEPSKSLAILLRLFIEGKL